MGDALRRQDVDKSASEPNVERPLHETEKVEASEVAGAASPVPSPAKELQAKLDKHFALRSSKFSGRFITWLVIGTCAGTWLTGVGLYSTL